MSVNDLLPLPEGKMLEFKRDLSSPKPILKTLVAFANTAGGTLIIGRGDDGSIVGIENILADEERLASLIADCIAPAMMPDIEAVTIDAKSLLLIRVAHWPGPFYLKEKGAINEVFVRLGSTNRQADEATRQDIPSLLDAVADVPRFIARNTRLASKIESMQRRDIAEYPAIAVREVLINALAHADYGRSGMRIMVSIFYDRLEIQSPGALPFGMTLDDFRAGVSHVRNIVVSRVLHELGLMEQWGSGYQRIINACRQGGYPEPEWQELASCVRVIFRPHPDVPVNVPVNVPVADAALNERQQWFLEQLSVGRSVKAVDIEAQWGVVEKTAKRDISALKKMDLIVFVGAPKTGRYQLKDSQ